MTEDDTINKLKLLKAVRPTDPTVESMKREIFYRIQIDNRQSFSFRPVLYASLVVIVLLLAFTATVRQLSSGIEQVFVTAEIRVAQNKYQKANIALAYARERLADLKNENSQLTTMQVQNISQATNVANTQLASLDLVGEPGKYSGAQCQQLYKQYFNYLEEVRNTMVSKTVSAGDNASKQSFMLFSTQLDGYMQQARVKLGSY